MKNVRMVQHVDTSSRKDVISCMKREMISPGSRCSPEGPGKPGSTTSQGQFRPGRYPDRRSGRRTDISSPGERRGNRTRGTDRCDSEMITGSISPGKNTGSRRSDMRAGGSSLDRSRDLSNPGRSSDSRAPGRRTGSSTCSSDRPSLASLGPGVTEE